MKKQLNIWFQGSNIKYKVLLSCFFILFLNIVSLGQKQPLSSQNSHAVPGFLDRGIMYQIWMPTFTKEGTLKAVTARLPYIADLGANIVYLSPLNLHNHPYSIIDFDVINPRYGTEADLRALALEAHRLGLKVIMDIVFAYTDPNDCVLLKRPGFHLRTPDGKLIMMPRWDCPRLDYTNPEVRKYFLGKMMHWIKNEGIDGFRCDMADFVPVDFWEEARAEMDKVNRDVIMLAEADSPEQQLKAIDISYNFQYYADLQSVLLNGESATRIRQGWEKYKASFPQGSRFLHSIDNHDRNRVDLVFGERATLAMTVLNFTLDGIPFIYNGNEIGDVTPASTSDSVSIRWNKGRPRRLELLSPQERRQFYKGLIVMRKQEASLTSGDLIWVENSNPDGVVSFIRRIQTEKGTEEILILINISNRQTIVQVDVPALNYINARDLLMDFPFASSLSLSLTATKPAAILDIRNLNSIKVAEKADPDLPGTQQVTPLALSDNKLICKLGAFGYIAVKRLQGYPLSR